MKNNKILTKKDVSKSAWTWMFFHHCAQNYERMQGLAYCHTLSKPLEKIYKDDKKGLSEALKRNLVFFNTEPQLGSIVPGISLALEEDYYLNGKDGNTDLMTNVKNSLMGPLAGIGDSLLVGTLNPILLSIGIGLSEGGSPLGPLTFLFLWLAIVIPMKYLLFIKGYTLGIDAVKILSDTKLKNMLTTFLSIVGLIVIGAVASTTIKAPIALQFTSGKMVISLQEIFEKILPKFIPLVLTLVSFYLVKIKKWSTNKLLISIFILSFILVIVGIM
ncbi:PTS system mannose/fructose/sorbose family transporter subunit IID [Helcococcus ovis]|uniref:PTS system mannose/fructose/sorbose family transporter subunit IID n=3 Tax=Helcococcus ovis TaxID=72026 RepID=UPI00106F2F4B|nr:PTS system mannose/fructose/sorbose family transporter subunit IID [Helcococcus ovis]TFF68790.1 PTS system mannose/fructose/sorbose family transporter subunit IID [Helcococcus ovis]WNZ01192.1 PTS system mannose/fructose/sorbose family transporter subunit IID [Helcococcus ovis]